MTTTRLAWALFAICVVLLIVTLVASAFVPEPFWTFVLLSTFVVTPGVGALVASRQPQNAIGWLLLASGLGLGIAGAGSEYAAVGGRHSLAFAALGAWLASLADIVSVVSAGVLLPLLFPNGRLLSPRWRPAAYLTAAALLFAGVGTAFAPGEFDMPGVTLENPVGIEGADLVQFIGYLLTGVTAIVAGLSLVLRLRRSRGDERQQLKWFAFVAVLLILTFAAQAVSVIEVAFYVLLYFGLPAAIGVAILRYRLYDIDRIISRTLSYGVLTVSLGATYFGLVLGLQALLRPVSGGSNLALVVTTLVVAALFLPARRRVQDTVDRRFNRRQYDAARTVEAFAARLRQQSDLDALQRELLAVIGETMQPAGVSIWLRNPQ